MAVERAGAGASLIDVLDRVLDKGIVIDAWVRVSLVGIDLITVEARVTVASIDTYLRYSDVLAETGPMSTRTVVVHGATQVEVSDAVPRGSAAVVQASAIRRRR